MAAARLRPPLPPPLPSAQLGFRNHPWRHSRPSAPGRPHPACSQTRLDGSREFLTSPQGRRRSQGSCLCQLPSPAWSPPHTARAAGGPRPGSVCPQPCPAPRHSHGPGGAVCSHLLSTPFPFLPSHIAPPPGPFTKTGGIRLGAPSVCPAAGAASCPFGIRWNDFHRSPSQKQALRSPCPRLSSWSLLAASSGRQSQLLKEGLHLTWRRQRYSSAVAPLPGARPPSGPTAHSPRSSPSSCLPRVSAGTSSRPRQRPHVCDARRLLPEARTGSRLPARQLPGRLLTAALTQLRGPENPSPGLPVPRSSSAPHPQD